MVDRLGPQADSVVVDIGTGAGQFAIAVAAKCARVDAVGVSPVMLTALRAKVVQPVGTVEVVEVVEAGFLTYEHQGRPADVIFSRYALRHSPDLEGRRARSAARSPAARRRPADLVRGLQRDPADAQTNLEAWCSTGGPPAAQGWSCGDYEEHVRDEHSTYSWFLRAVAQRAGFVIEQRSSTASAAGADETRTRSR